MNQRFKISLTPVIISEFIISILFIYVFGVGNFVVFIMASMLLGVILLIIFWKNMLEFQLSGVKNMITQFSFVIAGFLLVFPGVLTSFFGFLILIVALFFQFFTKTRYRRTQRQNMQGNEEIIDVEIIEDGK
ncbi:MULTISPECIES: integral memnbrane protein [unclassified Campylobacter]|uniref:integral memnbrane protein n=1 Tax=unclassified Campylobacter TaxID=2593542 RepID=UPI001237E768|nr:MULTISPECIES: integral memnbrane protein [unclassified Campylobacter]KAA6225371.1 integral memnbrane protein [Campylobacter sp. LR185c]KAA6227067.1 integral memnbrane protein [Campylobacter sp. LR196d]KAA6227638.1 integral memnbrane protein [Campylobacter sp. LR286c]KAA6229503.1 integral memnbrane protein [Campylobacter sp. LR264d]KAA6230747.1 integral memnbrane protein [Campylobacter sp. LR291e]